MIAAQDTDREDWTYAQTFVTKLKCDPERAVQAGRDLQQQGLVREHWVGGPGDDAAEGGGRAQQRRKLQQQQSHRGRGHPRL